MKKMDYFQSFCRFLFVLISISPFFITGCDDTDTGIDWNSAISPEIVYLNRDAAGDGRIFDEYIEDPVSHMQNVARNVCRLLYHNPDEVPELTKITLIIEYFDGISYKSGSRPEITIAFSSKYLRTIKDRGIDVLYEIDGILHHEVTHGYQYDDGDRYSEIHGVIEGVADTVRYWAGYIPDSDRHHGGNWDSGYKTTAFFFVWIENEIYPDFLYELNQSLDPYDGILWTWDEIENITGESVSSLWSQYQSSF